jgi:hypothetical protein
VKARRGEPSVIEDVMTHLAPHASDPIRQIPVYILVPVQLSIWTDNVGLTRFVYDVTFQEGNLVGITTGNHGH